MFKLKLREIAKDLDVAIVCFDEAVLILEGLEDCSVTEEHRKRIKELSGRCIQLQWLRDEPGIMILERALHCCNVEQAIKEISKVREEFKDARSLINI